MATQRIVSQKPMVASQKALIKSPYVYVKFNQAPGATNILDRGTLTPVTKSYPVNGTLNAVWSSPGFINPNAANSNYVALNDPAYKAHFSMDTLAGVGQLLLFYEVKSSGFVQVAGPTDQYIFAYGHFSGANSLQVYLDKGLGNISHRVTDNASTLYSKSHNILAGAVPITKVVVLFDFINQQVLTGINGNAAASSSFTGATFGPTNTNRVPTLMSKSDTSPGLYLSHSIFLSEFACFRITGDISSLFSGLTTVWDGTEAHGLPWDTLVSMGV